jgi:hypothetical protein
VAGGDVTQTVDDRFRVRRAPSERAPTRASAVLFEAKTAALRLRRAVTELGRAPPRLARSADAGAYPVLAARSTTPLWSEPALAEASFQLGKAHNLRAAARRLDGLVIPAGAVFSFWRQVGRASRRRGFVAGRMLREGCMVPAVGGGLCQLSNALYDVALQAGCQILERHAHSRIVPGSAAAAGRDATVAWNYVDLRLASDRGLRLSVRLERATLSVALWAREPAAEPTAAAQPAFAPGPEQAADSCGLCDQTDCFRHEHGRRGPALLAGRTAFVVDEAWPEHIAYVAAERRRGDLLCAPRLGRWPGKGFAEAVEAPLQAAMRAWAWRTTPAEGPGRRAAEARTSAAIAQALGARLGPEVTELCVAQSLAPFLWRDGWLGGRRFRVLMTRLPMAELQARLDAEALAHPERPTLADYRAPAWLAQAEAEALAAADALVTPHADVASLFGDRAIRLDWAAPAAAPSWRPGDVLAFPGPTLARKGALEIREAARRLGLAVRPLGAELEGAGFWAGVRLDRSSGPAHWLDGVAAVVQPALVEAAPRRLLGALAAGAPVIATAACRLGARPGVTQTPPGDVVALVRAIAEALKR